LLLEFRDVVGLLLEGTVKVVGMVYYFVRLRLLLDDALTFLLDDSSPEAPIACSILVYDKSLLLRLVIPLLHFIAPNEISLRCDLILISPQYCRVPYHLVPLACYARSYYEHRLLCELRR